MSTNTLQTLSRRAGGNFSSLNALSHSRAATCWRTCPSSLKTYSALSSRQSRDSAFSLAPSSPRFTPNIVALPITSQRHVSFKEMREERARQRRGEPSPAAKEEKKKPEPARTAKPEQAKESSEEAPATEQYTSSEADAVFARMKAASEAEWARMEEQERRAQEQAASEGAEKAEGAEGAEDAEAKQNQQQKKKKKAEEEPAEAPHGNKSPWQVFTETLSTEFKASKEWNESTKELSGSIHDFTQNPNVQKARTAYTKAAEGVSSTTGKVVMGTAGAIGKGAAWTWQTPVVKGIRYGAAAVGSGVEKVTRPVRETEAYKNVKEVVDDGASQRYGGWTEREERKKRRAERDLKQGYKPQEVHEEDPDAGTNVTLHKDSVWKESWKSFTENNSVMQRLFRMGSEYRESENPLISTARGVSDRIAGFFAENETAQVIKKFREMEPSFQLEPFLNEMRSYILPEVLEAYVKGDVETLKLWLSAAQFQVYHALMQQYTTAGLKSDGQIVDIRNVDVLSARMLDPGEIPVFVLMCRTQEVHVYRNAKTGELAAGMEDKVQQVTYAIGITRIPEEVSNPETRGWRLIELQKSARDYM